MRDIYQTNYIYFSNAQLFPNHFIKEFYEINKEVKKFGCKSIFFILEKKGDFGFITATMIAFVSVTNLLTFMFQFYDPHIQCCAYIT